jgi:hypothetical protein
LVLRNAESLTCPHWLVSGYPSIQELAAAISTAQDPVVEGSGMDSAGEVWVLRCRPTVLRQGMQMAPGPQAMLTSDWRVMLLHTTGLPARIQPTDPESGMRGVVVSSLQRATPPTAKDWRLLAGPVKVRRTRALECDAAVPGSVESATASVRAEFAAYMRSQFPVQRTPSER